ncbi:MAG: electron transport complex subunit RsxC, partial [Oscillospiraceae bacterium]|nr:electron transport complex subunit RsxC [Oscillospiraceae bacterium]
MFPGGIHPREGKNGKAVNGLNPIRPLDAPPRVIIPLQQHIGAPAKAIVSPGDHVRLGEKIAEAGGFVSAPIHSSVSGTVHAVQDSLLPNGTMAPALIIDNDYTEEWIE